MTSETGCGTVEERDIALRGQGSAQCTYLSKDRVNVVVESSNFTICE
jgi:hypothetical protein